MSSAPRTIGEVIDDQYAEDFPFDQLDEGWDLEEEIGPPGPLPWRKPLLIAVAVLTAVAMALLPIYNVFFAREVADNGLEVCGFDYCIVVDAVREEGLDLTMSSLSNTFLDDAETRELVDAASDYLNVAPLGLEVVDDLEGRLGGIYDPATRLIRIERPARSWTVLHEVAHSVAGGHGTEFQRVLIDLAQWAETSPSADD